MIGPTNFPMKLLNLAATAALILSCLVIHAAVPVPSDARVYEMRIYYSPDGKFETLQGRFREHTTRLFTKHGIENIGYWTPVENPERKLIYVLAYPSRDAREKSWKEFFADPDWQAAAKESEKNGRIVSKVESYFLQLTDYSPVPKLEVDPAGRVFELRTYTAAPGKLADLNKRFRDHTVKLFEGHGMKNIAYWNLMPDQKEADAKLIYILAHKSQDAAKKSFDEFRKDPAWIAAKAESEKGGPLTVDGGVKSEFLVATDYSPIK